MINVNDLIEVKLEDGEAFYKVMETLTRIGIPNRKDPDNKKLYQSCHILHKQGKYYLVHFKELYALDGRESTMTDADRARRNKIANLLHDWNLLEVVDKSKTEFTECENSFFRVVRHAEKGEWELITKYAIGKYSNNPTKEVA